MTTDKDGYDLIKSFEELRLVPYLCPAGIWTNGWGHTHGITASTPKIDEPQAGMDRGVGVGMYGG
jgi:lysozyme